MIEATHFTPSAMAATVISMGVLASGLHLSVSSPKEKDVRHIMTHLCKYHRSM